MASCMHPLCLGLSPLLECVDISLSPLLYISLLPSLSKTRASAMA